MRALVCGAGIAGLTTAWWLEHTGWDVVIVEHAPRLRDEGYLIDFWGAGYDVAGRMGLLPRLRADAHDVDRVSYVDADGSAVSHLDYDLFARMQDGRLLTLLRGDLEHALHDALGTRVDLRLSTSVDRIEGTGDAVTATLSDGSAERVDLLVGADGIHSRIRALAFGPEQRFLRFLDLHAATHLIRAPDLASRLGGRFAMRTVPGRVVGCYPVHDDHVAALYAFRVAHPAVPADPRAALRSAFADLGWVVPAMLARCPTPPELYYDQVAQVELPSWHRGRVVLVGDACQAVSLLAGQGASLAMGGAFALATALATHADVSAALAAYERRVHPVIDRTQAAGRRTAKWFVPDSRARIRVRDAALRLSTLRPLEWLLRPVLTTPSDTLADDALAGTAARR